MIPVEFIHSDTLQKQAHSGNQCLVLILGYLILVLHSYTLRVEVTDAFMLSLVLLRGKSRRINKKDAISNSRLLKY